MSSLRDLKSKFQSSHVFKNEEGKRYGVFTPTKISRARVSLDETLLAEENLTAGQGLPSHQEIAAAAYEIYLSRGCAEGGDLEDWLVAEQKLMRTSALSAPFSKRATA